MSNVKGVYLSIIYYIYLSVKQIIMFQPQEPRTESSCCSVTHSCPTLCDPMDCSTPSFPVHHHLLELAQTHVHWVSDAIQLYHPMSSPSPASIFPRIRVFSNESAFRNRWPKYWRFSLSISPSNKYSGLISFRID